MEEYSEAIIAQRNALKFLLDSEIIDDPQVINTIKLNVLSCSKSIKDLEFLCVQEKKQMLILLEFNWLAKIPFIKTRALEDAKVMAYELLPSYQIRVTDDPEIMKLANKRVEKYLKGGSDEIHNPNITIKSGS